MAGVPIEAKYGKRIVFGELSGLASFLGSSEAKSGPVVSKYDLGARSGYAAIPAAVFLLLM